MYLVKVESDAVRVHSAVLFISLLPTLAVV